VGVLVKDSTTKTLEDVMKAQVIDKVWVDEFESLGEALRYAQDNKNRRSSDTKSERDWYGSPDLDTAVQMGLDGWHDIRPEVDALFSRMEEQINMAIGDVFEMRYDYGGDSVDIDRFLMGDPECMLEYDVVPSGRMGRVVKVLVNGAASCNVSAKEIQQRGALAVALVDVLNKLGVGVEVWLESATEYENKYHSQLIKLHSSEERLDVNNLMFAMAHPSMLRRVGFSILEKTGWEPAKRCAQINAGYGRPHNMTQAERIEADVKIERIQNATGDPVADGVAYIMSTVKGLDLL
jgi:hypothetical protein